MLIYGLSCRCHPDSGVRYVGQTRVDLKARMSGHFNEAKRLDRPIHRWIRKHGSSNVVSVVLEHVESADLLDEREIHWITTLDTFAGTNPRGLNRTTGGQNSLSYEPSAKAAAEKNSGEKSSSSKLNWEAVADIRSRYASLTVPASKLAREYGVSVGAIQNVIANKTWRDPAYVDSGERYTGRPTTLEGRKSRFSMAQATEMRSRFQTPGVRLNDIARDFGCSEGMVSMIVRNLAYTDPNYVYQPVLKGPKISSALKTYYRNNQK